MPIMYDLCSGLGGASEGFKTRGWQVITLDNDPKFGPDIVADLTTWTYNGPDRPRFIWASPPCLEFSRESMPWTRRGIEPDLEIVRACKRIIDEARPKYWIIENVRGAVPFFRDLLGTPALIVGPFYLWGFIPPIGRVRLNMVKKESLSGKDRELRAKIPISLSTAIAVASENDNLL